jgi:hypothetical protein
LQFNDLIDQIISCYIIGKTGLFPLVGNFKEQNLQIFGNNYAIFYLKNLLAFFVVFPSFHKTDKSEAKEPKAKRSCCSKNDLKII